MKKWKEGELTKTFTVRGREIIVKARKLQQSTNAHIIEFEWNDADVTFADLLESGGELPIPPYLNRKTEDKDLETYQTVYSKIKGSVAAPTAGLHFTPEVFSSLKKKGIETDEVTLHVGAGTLKPVKSETISDHEMHAEFISVKKDVIKKLLEHKGKIIAVGTTSVRTIESLYYIGESLSRGDEQTIKVNQWQPYDTESNKISKKEALSNILNYLEKNELDTLIADTQIIIAPGYKYKYVDGIVTNFHQPKSTLLLLVSAFIPDNDWLKIYKHALNNSYRFLSYGDSSLLLKD